MAMRCSIAIFFIKLVHFVAFINKKSIISLLF